MDQNLAILSHLIAVTGTFNHYAVNIFGRENVVCIIRLLQMFKCTLTNFIKEANTMNPDQTTSEGAV